MKRRIQGDRNVLDLGFGPQAIWASRPPLSTRRGPMRGEFLIMETFLGHSFINEASLIDRIQSLSVKLMNLASLFPRLLGCFFRSISHFPFVHHLLFIRSRTWKYASLYFVGLRKLRKGQAVHFVQKSSAGRRPDRTRCRAGFGSDWACPGSDGDACVGGEETNEIVHEPMESCNVDSDTLFTRRQSSCSP